MKKQWILRNVKNNYDELAQKHRLDPLVLKILANRGITTDEQIDTFIHPKLEKLHSPDLLKDVEKAILIIKDCIKNQKKIRVVGDYDQDGNASVVLLIKGLKKQKAKIDYVIPHRMEDGYGINDRIVEQAKNEDVDTIMTCDNGIGAFESIAYAKRLGIRVIITDHHEICIKNEKECLPDADAIINPKRKDCVYPFKDLCGAGVAFKVLQAYYSSENLSMDDVYELIEFVAMGTICDIVSLTDENRILVQYGLQKMSKTKHVGLKALMEVAGLAQKEISSYHVGFILGPCINASGRLDSAHIAVDLMLCDDMKKAHQYASFLFQLNEDRKVLTKKGFLDLCKKGDTEEKGYYPMVLFHPDLHESVAGIVAGRLRDRYYRPVLVITNSNEDHIIKGSARSIEGYDIHQALTNCKEELLHYGGHPMAAGFSLEKKNLNVFKKKMNCCTAEKELFISKIEIDSQLPFYYINEKLIEELNILEPFGKDNPKPLFARKKVWVKGYTILGKDQNVMKLALLDDKEELSGIFFGNCKEMETYIKEKQKKSKDHDSHHCKMDFIFHPNINEYRQKKSIQLIIEQYR